MSRNKPPYTASLYRWGSGDDCCYIRVLRGERRTFEDDAARAVEAGYVLDKVVPTGDILSSIVVVWKLEEEANQ